MSNPIPAPSLQSKSAIGAFGFALFWALSSALTFALVSALFHNFTVVGRFSPSLAGLGEFEAGAALFGALLAGVPALLIGLWQWLVLRRYAIVGRGWILSVSAGFAAQHFLADGFPDAADKTYTVAIGALVIALIQWRLLRRARPAMARLWLPVTALAWLLSWVLGIVLLGALGLRDLPWTPDLGVQQHGILGAFVGLGYGFASGVLLARGRMLGAREGV